MLNLFHLSAFVLLLFNYSIAPSPKALSTHHASTNNIGRPVEETEDYIPWVGPRRLSWEDFRCEPKRNTDAVALTSTALGISYKMNNGHLSYEITCSFSKTKSWGLLKTPYILAHEQGHFDITEIYARKLYKELLNYKFNKKTYRQDVNDIYDRVVKQKENFQYAYDGETDHSRNKKVQQEWLERIEKILEDTEPYVDYP